MLSKERQAKRRANIKKDNEAYQTYLKKDRQRKAAQRSAARVALTTAEVEEDRLKERQHIRDYRAKKKSQAQEGEASQLLMSTPYRSSQAIGKGDIYQIKPQLDAKWEGVLVCWLCPRHIKCTASFRKGKEWLWFGIPVIQKNTP